MSAGNGFTQDDVEQILRIVDRMTDVEVRLETADIKLHVRKFNHGEREERADASSPTELRVAPVRVASPAVPGAATPAAPPAVAAPKDAAIPPGCVAVRAPMMGTFYRSPSPAEPAFVEVGARIRAADPVCIVEVMKLFNTVNAGVDGTIVAIVPVNGQMVEQDQALFIVKVD
jgi:acetyl-CoA carboxylase biotin carboxyl carrier protein